MRFFWSFFDYVARGPCFPAIVQFRSIHRSAGACPPRSFVYPRHGEGQALALRWRNGPSLRSAGACPPRSFSFAPCTVARGPVPRDRSSLHSMARDRPSPYGGTGRYYVARGPVPRDRSSPHVLKVWKTLMSIEKRHLKKLRSVGP